MTDACQVKQSKKRKLGASVPTPCNSTLKADGRRLMARWRRRPARSGAVTPVASPALALSSGCAGCLASCLASAPALTLLFVLQVLLLDLPPELLQRELLPLLSLQMWGALMLTCRALHALAADAPDCVLHAAARQTLPATHPVLRGQTRKRLLTQSRMDAAIAAGPDTWSWWQYPPLLDGFEEVATRPSPDWTKLATAQHGRLRVRSLHTMEALLDVPVLLGATSRHPDRGAFCSWASDSQALFWFSEVHEAGCQVSYLHLGSGHRSSLNLASTYRKQPVHPHVLPGSQQFLLALQCPSCGRHHPCITEAKGAALVSHTCPKALFRTPDSTCSAAAGVSSPLAFPTERASLCIWQPGAKPFVTQVPSTIASLAWSPDGSTLLCACQTEVVFLDAAGSVLAQQPLHALTGTSWGLGKVMGRSTDPGKCRSAVETYRVVSGPRLALVHTLEMSFQPRPIDLLVCSPDWRYVAFAAGLEYEGPTHLVVSRVLEAAQGRPAAVPVRQQLGVEMLTGAPQVRKCTHRTPRWLPDSTGVMLETAGLLSLV